MIKASLLFPNERRASKPPAGSRIHAAMPAAVLAIGAETRSLDKTMIRALLLDLGETLIDADRRVLPGVPQALSQLRQFETEDGEKLALCLVSDFKMPSPRTPQAIDAAFAEYLSILDQTGLRGFFEPVDERVTLSTQVGQLKPAVAVFKTALARAKIAGSITEALFITENAAHVAACRDSGMRALQFGRDFTDWSSAPLLVAKEIGPSSLKNFAAVFGTTLSARDELQLQSISNVDQNAVHGTARSLVKLEAPELGTLNGVHVELPVDLEATIGAGGQITAIRTTPRLDEVAEAVQQVQSLVSNQQVATDDATRPTPAVLPTHRLETDAQGRRILRRRRFTAL